MVQLLTLLDTIFDDKLVPCHLIFLRTLHTVAKLLEWSFWTSSGSSKIITYPCWSMKGEVGDKYGVKAMDFGG